MITTKVFVMYVFSLFVLINPSIVSSYVLPYYRSKIPYSDYCNSVVPKALPLHDFPFPSTYPQFQYGYYIGGDNLFNLNSQLSPKFSKGVSFRVNYPDKTNNDDVIKLNGHLTFRTPNVYPGAQFYLDGYWSKSSGKLCMVGSGTGFFLEQGKDSEFYYVFKLNHPQNSNIGTSFVTGTFESVNKTTSSNYFEPISIMAFSQLNYDYNLISNEGKSGYSSLGDRKKGLSLSSALAWVVLDKDICAALDSETRGFELDYEGGCNKAKNCSPIGGADGFLPILMSFSGFHCSEDNRMRMLIGFYNSSFNEYDQPLVPNRMLVGEGAWDAESNRLHLVVCRILNVSDSLADYSVGDCSMRLSLWFPAIMSLRNRRTVVGELWSSKTIGESGYFDRIKFRSMSIRRWPVSGLKYEYTETSRVKESCVEKIGGGERKRYPDPNSYYDLMFDMAVGNDRRGRGFAKPWTVGDRFIVESKDLKLLRSMWWNSVSIANISYKISFTPQDSSKLADQYSTPSKLIDIVAEGVYNTETGGLCMIGCRFLWSKFHHSIKSSSMDCQVIIRVQFPEINAKHENYVRGSIESTRGKSDPLYFDRLDFVSLSLSRKQALEATWRMDLEIIMVIFTITVVCVFVSSQIFYVKKHPDVLPSISLVMLVILTLGHLVPLVLNFEALFLSNRNQQSVLVGSGGWAEVNQVIVWVITIIAFMLQFYLLKLTWSSRLGDGKQKVLWLHEKKALYVFLPLCLVSGFIAWLNNPYKTLDHIRHRFHIIGRHPGQSISWNLRPYAGLLLDGFLLPQILLNAFWNSKDKALSASFYLGTTAVRLLPHAYNLYRAHKFSPSSYEQHTYYANPREDFFSTAWDIIIPCGSLLFAMIIYFQQRLGGSCILPSCFRVATEYEKLPVTNATDC